MKKAVFAFILAFCLVSFFSCRKPISSGDRELVGTWEGFGSSEVVIDFDGSGHCTYSPSFGSTASIKGSVKIEGEKLIFKALRKSKTYSIDERPHKNATGTLTIMTLDGDVYAKQ